MADQERETVTGGIKWKYLAPNAVTLASMGLGFMAVAMTLKGRFEFAAWLIVTTVLLDKLDGTVARLLNASSKFGEQMDSFADLVSFGVAPAVVLVGAVTSASSPLASAGASDPLYQAVAYACAAIYVGAAALRLARFNILSEDYGHHHFFGFPTTLSGALLATAYLTWAKWGDTIPGFFVYFTPVAEAGLAILMVSNVPLPKLHKRGVLWFDIFQGVNILLIYIIGLTWFLIPDAYRFPEYLFGAAFFYAVIGSLRAGWQGVKPPPIKRRSE